MAATTRSSSPRPTMFMINLLSSFFLQVLLLSLQMQQCSAGNGCLQEGSSSTTLLSPGNIFELGLFTPDGTTQNRYLGIWYRNYTSMKIVVWVANRSKPLLEPNASLTVGDGIAKLLDKHGSTYWSSYSGPVDSNSGSTSPNLLLHISFKPPSNATHGGNKTSSLNSTRLCLLDSGNLILERRYPLNQPIWQSFDHPTDTFLPGMVAAVGGENRNLTSWQSSSIPAPGDFTLQIQQTYLTTVLKTGSIYWESTDPPQKLIDLFLGNLSKNNLTRLVIEFTGRVQLWEWDNAAGWNLTWFEPIDRCSEYSVCGDFGSCNSYNELLCKCLPGFTPTVLANWTAKIFSGGCSPKSQSCGRNFSDDTFLTLPKMKVDYSNSKVYSEEKDCKAKCLRDCHCVAYFSDVANPTVSGTESNCSIWRSTDLTGLQEEYPGGITLHVRTTRSDIALTSRDCDPCGTYSIPYPLSTSATCGDPLYFYFHCNTTTGQVIFRTSNGTFNVTSISQKAKSPETFSIQVAPANSCDSTTMELIGLSNMEIFPFNVRNCTNFSYQSLELNQPFIEVEIGWQSPPEPACSVSSDCHDWPHTSCKAAKGGKMRCICVSNFKWDGLSLKCKRGFPVKVLIACIAAALAIVFLGGVVFIYRRRRIVRETGSVELMGDNSERIDLPFFEWESILSATNNFADDNKLGTGGFGSVYRGGLSDGREIAVKRLSSVSVQGVEEFRTEVVLIAKLQHRNLVRLLGYCVKSDEKILVYEYMPNGSLDSCLFDESSSVNLDWEKRFDIVTGIARGLLYLHQDSRLIIIHRDLKPSNILLDEDLNPKISDFGIARIVEGKQTESSTIRVVGTYGYMSPEYAHEGIFSVKSDVFSFGVVVLETISGRRNSRIFIFEHGLSLLGHAWKLWNEDRGMDLADQTLKKSCNISEVLKCIQIALLCVQEDPNDRPTMSAVVLMLSSENASLPPAKQPAFSTRKPPLETGSSSSAVDSSSSGMPITVSTVGR